MRSEQRATLQVRELVRPAVECCIFIIKNTLNQSLNL